MDFFSFLFFFFHKFCSISAPASVKTCRQPLYFQQAEAPSSGRTSYLRPSKSDGRRCRRVVSHLVSVAASLLLMDFQDDLKMMRCDCSELEPRPCAIKAPVGDQSSAPARRTLNNLKVPLRVSNPMERRQHSPTYFARCQIHSGCGTYPVYLCILCAESRPCGGFGTAHGGSVEGGPRR